jgi:hypothetical protein
MNYKVVKMKMGKNWVLCLLSGFGITFLCAIFVFFGVQLMLYLLKALRVQKDIVVIFSSIFYGMVYLIARAVVNVRRHRQGSHFALEELEASMDESSESKPQIPEFRLTAWFLFGIFSVMWLTPALVIYWASPVYPNKIIVIFSFIFSLPTAIIYYLLNDRKFQSLTDRLVFYLGACSGFIVAIFLIKICVVYL